MLVAFVASLSLAQVAAATSLLLVHADSGSYATGAQAAMVATGRFTTVDTYDANSVTPTLPYLSGYDAILAWTNYIPSDRTGLGDVLADYYELGGKALTVATYSFSDPWSLRGELTTPPFVGLTNLGTNGDVSGLLSAVVPGDVIFNGINLAAVSYYHNSNFAHPGLGAGAQLLATDGAGIYMIARSANGVINVNLFPGYISGNNDEFYNLLANTFQPGGPPPVPEPGSMLLLGTGLVGLGRVWRKRRK